MKYIQKNDNEPQFLIDYRNTTEIGNQSKSHKDIWNSFTKLHGEDCWDILWKEQGGICAYCGSRIDNKDGNYTFDENRNEKGQKRREHLKPKSKAEYRNDILSYFNLVAVCQGNSTKGVNKGKNNLHCDARKDKDLIAIFPTDEDCEDFFEYEEVIENVEIFGTQQRIVVAIKIVGKNQDARNTIVTLNLDYNFLRQRRNKYNVADVQIRNFLKRILKTDNRKEEQDKILIEELEKYVINIYQKSVLEECCFVTKFFIQKEIEDLKKLNT